MADVSDQYAELARHYHAHSETIKNNLLTAVPWVLGIAAGLIGFAVRDGKLLLSDPDRRDLWIAVVFSLLGAAVSGMALSLVKDFKKHSAENWARAATAMTSLRDRGDPDDPVKHPYIEVWGTEDFDKARKETGTAPTVEKIQVAAGVFLAAAIVVGAAGLVRIITCI